MTGGVNTEGIKLQRRFAFDLAELTAQHKPGVFVFHSGEKRLNRRAQLRCREAVIKIKV